MGTVPHHQARSHDFLTRARDAAAAADFTEAGNALRRAASHAITALSVHNGQRHNTTRRLENTIFRHIASGQFTRSHLKTFRHTYTLPTHLSSPDQSEPSPRLRRRPGPDRNPAQGRNGPIRAAACGQPAPANKPGQRNPAQGEPTRSILTRSKPSHTGTLPGRKHSPARVPARGAPVEPRDTRAASTLRRMIRRVAALIRVADAIVAGQSKPARQHKRWLRGLPSREVHPKPPSITGVRDILHLPNYRSIAETYDLTGVPLAKQPDPHGMYAHGRSPLPCSCHPETRALPSHSTDTINLSPLWRRALERALGIPVPTTLPA